MNCLISVKNIYQLPVTEIGATGNLERAIGKGLSNIVSQLDIDYPSCPKYTAKMNSPKNCKSEFYLINTNNTWLEKNFQFIQAIFAGANWVHLKFCIVQKPNVYYVICPGRFQYIWASLEVSVTTVGKLRKNLSISRKLNGMGINSIDDDTLWPDAWKINLTFKDMTPNNFNMYSQYYMNGFVPDEMAILEVAQSAKDILMQLPDLLKELGNDAVTQFKETTENSDLIKDMSDSIKAFISSSNSDKDYEQAKLEIQEKQLLKLQKEKLDKTKEINELEEKLNEETLSEDEKYIIQKDIESEKSELIKLNQQINKQQITIDKQKETINAAQQKAQEEAQKKAQEEAQKKAQEEAQKKAQEEAKKVEEETKKANENANETTYVLNRQQTVDNSEYNSSISYTEID